MMPVLPERPLLEIVRVTRGLAFGAHKASVGWGCRLVRITTEKSYSYRKESEGSVILAGIQTQSQYASI